MQRLNFSVISERPLIVRIYDTGRPFAVPQLIGPRLGDRRCTFLLSLSWSLEAKYLSGQWFETLKSYREYVAAHRNHRFIVLCNTAVECEIVASFGIENLLVNSSCYIDEAVLKPEPTEKKWDACYNARMAPFKRHALARKIESLCLVYTRYGQPHRDYYESVRQSLSHAHFVNGDPFSDHYRLLEKPEVADIVNRCHVGLCLSAMEGHMHAAVEYLLCGLPIVNTPNQGGRDVCFDAEVCLTVPADEDAVAGAVKELIARDIPATRIRELTLKRIEPHRERFIDLIRGLYAEDGADWDLEADWNSAWSERVRFCSWPPEKVVELPIFNGGGDTRSPLHKFKSRLGL